MSTLEIGKGTHKTSHPRKNLSLRSPRHACSNFTQALPRVQENFLILVQWFCPIVALILCSGLSPLLAIVCSQRAPTELCHRSRALWCSISSLVWAVLIGAAPHFYVINKFWSAFVSATPTMVLIHYSLVDYLPPTVIQPTHLYLLSRSCMPGRGMLALPTGMWYML